MTIKTTDSTVTILFIGDVVGKPGRRAVRDLLDGLVDEHNIDLVVANAENAAGGFGITSDTARDLLDSGVHVLTTGNHVWDKKESLSLLEDAEYILRPANYPPGSPGKGLCTMKTPGGFDITVINLSGRIFMECVDCPFRKVDELLDVLPEENRCVIVDFHAEATSEKRAFSLYVDGRVSAVLGTHTHIQTADERILPSGTACITDVGMTGNEDGSVIGIDYNAARYRFLTQMPVRFDLAKGVPSLNGTLVTLQARTGRAIDIKRINLSLGRSVSP